MISSKIFSEKYSYGGKINEDSSPRLNLRCSFLSLSVSLSFLYLLIYSYSSAWKFSKFLPWVRNLHCQEDLWGRQGRLTASTLSDRLDRSLPYRFILCKSIKSIRNCCKIRVSKVWPTDITSKVVDKMVKELACVSLGRKVFTILRHRASLLSLSKPRAAALGFLSLSM